MALREKHMASNEWPAFQNAFEAVFMTMGAPSDMALFGRTDPADHSREIMLLAGRTDEAERLSPGAWENSEETTQHTWALLVGDGRAAEKFGLRLGHTG